LVFPITVTNLVQIDATVSPLCTFNVLLARLETPIISRPQNGFWRFDHYMGSYLIATGLEAVMYIFVLSHIVLK